MSNENQEMVKATGETSVTIAVKSDANPNGAEIKDLLALARSGDLRDADVVCNQSDIGPIVAVEAQTWSPKDRKAIAARTAVKVAQKIAMDRAKDLGLIK